MMTNFKNNIGMSEEDYEIYRKLNYNNDEPAVGTSVRYFGAAEGEILGYYMDGEAGYYSDMRAKS